MSKKFTAAIIFGFILLSVGFGTSQHTTQAQNYGSNWLGQYYNGTSTNNCGASFVFQRVDAQIQFNFGSGSVIDPNTGLSVGPGNYSVCWTTTQFFAAGTYTFSFTREDDGAVFIDGIPIISPSFQDRTGPEFITATQLLTEGAHQIRVELYVRSGNGSVQFQWQGSGQTGTAAPTATPTRTPLPPIPPGALTATVINASVLNTRDAPSLGGNVIGRILRGETYQVVGRDADARWFLLQLGGYQGWSWGYYLYINGNEFNAPIRSPFGTLGAPPGVIDTGVIAQAEATLRLREGPSVATRQIGRVVWGSFLPVIARTPDGYWYKVVWKGTIGWIYTPYVEITQGDLSKVPVEG